LQRLIHDRLGPCHITQLEETGAQPLSAVLDFVGNISSYISMSY
jgi:hypothetical protein